MSKREELDNIKESYYSIFLAFKVSEDVLNNVTDENIVDARSVLYSRLNNYVPNQEYDIFSSTVVIYQIEDDYSYLIVYSAFVRNKNRLPMDGYVTAREIKTSIRTEFENFFKSINLDYKLVNIKSLDK